MSVKKYLDNVQTGRLWAKCKEAFAAISHTHSDYLPKAGGTMTGKITLDGAPTSDLHAATKKYVDDNAGGDSLPSQSGNSGKFLTTDGTDASWATVSSDVFIAEYNVTTNAEISAAYQAGKTIFANRNNKIYNLASYYPPTSEFQFWHPDTGLKVAAMVCRIENGNSYWAYFTNSSSLGNITSSGDINTNGTEIQSGDRLVINDESASQLDNSSITFGSDTDKYLSNAGTWEDAPSEEDLYPLKTAVDFNGLGYYKRLSTLLDNRVVYDSDFVDGEARLLRGVPYALEFNRTYNVTIDGVTSVLTCVEDLNWTLLVIGEDKFIYCTLSDVSNTFDTLFDWYVLIDPGVEPPESMSISVELSGGTRTLVASTTVQTSDWEDWSEFWGMQVYGVSFESIGQNAANESMIIATVDGNQQTIKRRTYVPAFDYWYFVPDNGMLISSDTEATYLLSFDLPADDVTISVYAVDAYTEALSKISADMLDVSEIISNIPFASASERGIVNLNSSTSSSSTTEAATPYAVKQAYDKATAALPKSGGTMSGYLTLHDDPANNYHAATKKYVDDICGDIETALGALL